MLPRWAYEFLNVFFFAFHTALIFFNTLGWIFRKTRKWNLASLLITAFSWFVLGIWYGWGYCFCTEWHWQVREHLGYNTNSNSYIQFLVEELTGIRFPMKLVDIVTVIVFFLSLLLSLYVNLLMNRRKKHKKLEN
jgi:Protein of Unknown function (DUF2784)